MFQVDCLLSFAIGSSLATSASDGLKASQYRTQNKYFVFMLLHLSLIVRSVNTYMLWNYTAFDTLFYLDASIDGVWPALNCFGSIISGIIGFMAARKLLHWNQEKVAYTLWITAFSLYFAVISAHYDRLFYPGGIRDYYDGKSYTLDDYYQSKVFLAFAIKMMLIMAPVQYAQIYWPREEGFLTKTRKSDITRHCAKTFTLQGACLTLLAIVLKVAHLMPENWYWDRVLAVMCGHIVISLYLLTAVYLMSTKYVVTKRIDIRRSKQMQKPIKKRRPARAEHTTPSSNDLNDNGWEENSESSSVQEQEEQVIIMNGGSHHLEVNGKIE